MQKKGLPVGLEGDIKAGIDELIGYDSIVGGRFYG